MSHDELSDLLRNLPRTSASSGFTARTLARARGTTRHPGVLRAAFAALFTAVVILSAAGIQRHREQVRIEQLRVEEQQIRAELDELRAASEARQPKVYVGSSGPYDFVLPLRAESTAAAKPVSLHIANDAVY